MCVTKFIYATLTLIIQLTSIRTDFSFLGQSAGGNTPNAGLLIIAF